MKVYIDNASQAKRLFEGGLSFMEECSNNGNLEFLLALSGKTEDCEVYFKFKDEAELDFFIQELQQVKKAKKL